jgi:hypothetical protein
MKMWIVGASLCCFSVFAQAQGCQNKNVAASGVGGVAGSAIGAVMLGPAGEVLGGAVGGAVGSVVANGGKTQPSTMLGGAVGGAGGAILGRGLGGGRLLAVLGAGLGSAGGACVAQQATRGKGHQVARSNKHNTNNATAKAQRLLGS